MGEVFNNQVCVDQEIAGQKEPSCVDAPDLEPSKSLFVVLPTELIKTGISKVLALQEDLEQRAWALIWDKQ